MSGFFSYDVDLLTTYAILLLTTEFLTLLIFSRNNAGWKFRLSNRLIKTWKVATFMFILVVISFVFGDTISSLIQNSMKNFQYRELLTPAALILTFVWIWKFIVGKKLHRPMIVLLIMTIILVTIFISLNLELIQKYFNPLM